MIAADGHVGRYGNMLCPVRVLRRLGVVFIVGFLYEVPLFLSVSARTEHNSELKLLLTLTVGHA